MTLFCEVAGATRAGKTGPSKQNSQADLEFISLGERPIALTLERTDQTGE